jgi:EAL and modified HD-GYP domain-containing signal transduction protein
MSILRRILGGRPAPPPPPPPPPPLPPRGDLLTLAGGGLSADLSGDVEVTITAGGRTYAAATTRRGAAEFALHDFREIVPEPPPAPPPPPPPPPAPPAPAVAVAEPASPAPAVAVAEAPPLVAEPETDEIAVVRRPLTDPEGAVVGYELLVHAPDAGARATAALLLDAFGEIGLERLAGRHPAWIPMTPEFLLEVGTPPVRPDRVVLQLSVTELSEQVLSALQRLRFAGYTIATDGYDERLAALAQLVRIPVDGRSDDELQAAIAAPKQRGLQLVATGVANREELARCHALGFSVFQGDFFAAPDPTRQRRVGTGGISSLAALAEVAKPDATFEDLELAIGTDVGLSLKLLRYVNSAFFALPRTVESVREALTLLGTATVRRWATVMALVSATDAPEELVELALQRARMCEVLGGNRSLDASDGHFTVGLFSVADALLDTPMEDVLATLPFSDEIQAALLRREGPKGELLKTVVAYEKGAFPTAAGDVSPAQAYGEAVAYAGEAIRAAG